MACWHNMWRLDFLKKVQRRFNAFRRQKFDFVGIRYWWWLKKKKIDLLEWNCPSENSHFCGKSTMNGTFEKDWKRIGIKMNYFPHGNYAWCNYGSQDIVAGVDSFPDFVDMVIFINIQCQSNILYNIEFHPLSEDFNLLN